MNINNKNINNNEQSKPKKILVGIATNGTGGIDSYIYSFIKVAFKQGILCDILTTNYDKNFYNKISKYNANLLKIANLHNKKKIYIDINNICSINKNNNSVCSKYVGAYINISTALMYPYVKACYSCGIKNIVVHSHAHYNSQPNWAITKAFDIMHYYYRAKLNKLPITYAGCSTDACKWIAGQQIINKKNWIFIPNPIDVKKCTFNKDKRKEKINNLSTKININLARKTIIGTATAFMPYKNPLFLIDVFSQYLKTNKNAFLLVAGSGPMKKDMEEKSAKMLPKNSYKLLGHRNDVAELLQVFDCFVLPSKNEGLPLCILEAQAADLPIVMSNTITDEVIVLKNQVIKEDLNNAYKWSRAIEKLLNEKIKRSNKSAKLIDDAGFNLASPKKIIPYLTKS